MSRRAIALTIVAGCVLAAPPRAPSPAERRQAYVAAHPELAPAIVRAILAGDVVAGMTEPDLRAALGSPTASAISTDSRYQRQLEFRAPRRSTVSHFEGGSRWDEEVETGAVVCVVFLIDDRVADGTCALDAYPAPVPVAR